MKYTEMKQQHSDRFSNINIFFAFNKDQLNEGLIKFGLDPDNTAEIKEKLCSVTGGYMLKSEVHTIKNYYEEVEKETADFLKVPSQLKDAFIYEMGNSEYCITYDIEPPLTSLGLSAETLTAEQEQILIAARAEYLEQCDY